MKSMVLKFDDKDMPKICFLLFCKRKITFETIFCIVGIQNQIPEVTFPRKNAWAALYWIDPNFF